MEIERKLEKKIPYGRWGKTHHQMVLFGRYYCKASKPMCDTCKIRNICKYNKKSELFLLFFNSFSWTLFNGFVSYFF